MRLIQQEVDSDSLDSGEDDGMDRNEKIMFLYLKMPTLAQVPYAMVADRAFRLHSRRDDLERKKKKLAATRDQRRPRSPTPRFFNPAAVPPAVSAAILAHWALWSAGYLGDGRFATRFARVDSQLKPLFL